MRTLETRGGYGSRTSIVGGALAKKPKTAAIIGAFLSPANRATRGCGVP
jgi:hypothetical protein